MEEVSKRNVELTKNNKKELSSKIFNNLKESSKIFYRKYLRSTTYCDPLEKKKYQRKTSRNNNDWFY